VLAPSLLSAALCALPLHAGVFAGRVLEDHTGAPLPRTEIRVFRPDARGPVVETETDSEGRFRLPGLSPTEYRLQFSKPNYAGATLLLPSSPDTAALTLRLVRYGAISGHVFDSESRPVRSAQIVAMSQPAGASATEALTYNNDGAFRIYGLPPGRYRLAVLNTGEGDDLRRGAIWNPREFVIAGGEEYTGADFLVPPSAGVSVSGKLDMPEPVRTMSVALVAAGHPTLRVAMGITRPDGTFRFDHIRDGAYDLLASSPASGAPNFGRARIVVSSQPVEDLSVPVTHGGSVVLRTTGECAEGAIATLTAVESWLPEIRLSVPLHPPSPATLEHVAPGRFLLSVKGPRCYGATQSVLDFAGENAPVEVALGPPGSIRGRLTGAAPVADYVIVLIDAASLMQIALPDSEGRFAFEDLAPGSYSVTAHKATQAGRWMPESAHAPDVIEVSVGAVTPLDLRQFP
jgi:uncharacterized protein (DUF2141 family)